MKILVLFIDMLGGYYLNSINPDFPETKMDELIRSEGGTVYTQCYTPGPDTPRSCACMWTGVYPKENGCDNRLKWPAYFMDPQPENCWKILAEEKYTVNVYLRRASYDVGLIPYDDRIHFFHDSVFEFFDKAQITDNSFNMLYFHDLHRILDETAYSPEGYREGCDFIAGLVRTVIDYYHSLDLFDYVIMLSDHGFRMKDNKSGNYPGIYRDRVQTFMYLRKKGQGKELITDDKLRSNLDFMPTICDILHRKAANRTDGISLLDPKGHDYVFIEDHDTYTSEPGLPVLHWGVADANREFHWLHYSGKWEHEGDCKNFDEACCEEKISEKMSEYRKHRATYEVLEKIPSTRDDEGHFSDGTKYKNARYSFDKSDWLTNKKVVLYGAGIVGQDYYEQMADIPDCWVVLWIDKNHLAIGNTKMAVTGIESLEKADYDLVLICLKDPAVAADARELLESSGADPQKIIWRRPRKVREQ